MGSGRRGRSAVENRADPESMMSIFVDSPEWLIVFLEAVAEASASEMVDNTLLELYLSDAYDEQKALELLRNPRATYSDKQALILCQLNGFRAGTLFLLEKMRLFDQILEFHMQGEDDQAVMDVCSMHGEKSPSLLVKVLSYFSRKPSEAAQPYIVEILRIIDAKNLLPPLQVIQVLATNKTATLSCVKDYIQGRLKTQNDMIAADADEISRLQGETEKMRAEIASLQTEAKIFQSTKCSWCSNVLDLPIVNFMCSHSLHQGCLMEPESECPVCAKDNRHVLQVKASLESRAMDHEAFFSQLESSPDGFAVVADYMSRQMFNRVELVGAGPSSGGGGRGAGLSDAAMRSMLFG